MKGNNIFADHFSERFAAKTNILVISPTKLYEILTQNYFSCVDAVYIKRVDSFEMAFSLLKEKYFGLLILLDENEENFLDDVKMIKEEYPFISIILMTDTLNMDILIRAMSLDVGLDFVLPFSCSAEDLQRTILSCLENGGTKRASKILNSLHRYSTGKNSPIKEKRINREKRMKELVELIREKPQKFTLGGISLRMKISKRQVQRDIAFMKECGINFVITHNGIYIDEDEDEKEKNMNAANREGMGISRL